MSGHVHTSGTMEDRYKLAGYWWVAGEIVRRNPALELEETYPLDGFYDCLTIHGESNGRPVHIDLNRNGSIHVHPEHIGLVQAAELLTQVEPHTVVKRIEAAAGLTPGSTAPSSTGRTLVHRILARALHQLVVDKGIWDVRALTSQPRGHAISIPMGQSGGLDASPLPMVFPTPTDFEAFVVGARPLDGARPGRFWALKRDADVLAVLDARGVVHTSTSRTELVPLYERVGRNLTQTMAIALANVLP